MKCKTDGCNRPVHPIQDGVKAVFCHWCLGSVLSSDIEQLTEYGIGQKVTEGLRRAGIVTINGVLQKRVRELMGIKNTSEKTARQVQRAAVDILEGVEPEHPERAEIEARTAATPRGVASKGRASRLKPDGKRSIKMTSGLREYRKVIVGRTGFGGMVQE